MAPRSLVVKSPASIMLFGEHSVLRGSLAIVAAIEQFLEVHVHERKDKEIHLISSFGSLVTDTDELAFPQTLRFVDVCFQHLKKDLTNGFDIEIISSINPQVGLGSSASVTCGLLYGLQTMMGKKCTKQALLQDAIKVIQTVQGSGSGADAASIIYGGVVAYSMKKYKVVPLLSELPLVLVYSGYKTPTKEVIRLVNEKEKEHPKIYKAIFSAISEVTFEAKEALHQKDMQKVGSLMNMANALMEALSLGTREMMAIRFHLLQDKGILGSKISGSGLGDSVVALGELTNKTPFQGKLLPSKVSKEGVQVTWTES
jgi:mevalonate kinase